MEAYVNYNYYKDEYKGNMPETNFNAVVLKATQKIKTSTFNRIDKNAIPEEVKQCTCAICDKLNTTIKTENKSSESVGTWSVSYLNNSIEDINKQLNNIIKEYLFNLTDKNGTPLLYRGCY